VADWRTPILKDFQSDINRLTLVSDPDGLLTEEKMLLEIKQRGFDLIPFEDPIAFRYAYESQYREIWDREEKTELVVVLRSQGDIAALPFDLVSVGRPLELSLHRLFPNLSYPVVASLDRSLLDDLYAAYVADNENRLGENATKDFVLRSCFRVERTMIQTEVDFLRATLPLVYAKKTLPPVLADHLADSLSGHDRFGKWNLRQMLSSQAEYLAVLQDSWQGYLASHLPNTGVTSDPVHEPPGYYEGETPSVDENGKSLAVFPFDHQDVRAYVDTFFLEGLLRRVKCESHAGLPAWAHVGVEHDPEADKRERFDGLLERLQTTLPQPTDTHQVWQLFARAWAEFVVLRWELDDRLPVDAKTTWGELHVVVETRFADWMQNRFSSLYNLPPIPEPVMVHHVPNYLAMIRNRESLRKVALVVMDGLALDQWVILRTILESKKPNWQMDESTVFAWVPSLTSISRQSIFAAQPPLYFADSLLGTDREPKHWKRFWEDQEVSADQIHYAKMIETGNTEALVDCLVDPYDSIVGIVVNTVDQIMHGEHQGTAGLHDAIHRGANKFISVLERLLNENYEVFLTADHGNIAATGVGSPSDGVLSEVNGKRARLYESETFLAQAHEKIPDSLVWNNVGLPQDRYALLPTEFSAFTSAGTSVVSHGGIAMEEIIVPLVRFRNTREES